uniref:Uncharacterized protein n=1 Tax=Bacillus phage Adastra TaxID=3143958 RepID=A0AAU8BCL1_9CAUD
MRNLYCETIDPPTISEKQEEALMIMVHLLPRKECFKVVYRKHGKWTGHYQPLNSIPKEKLYYILASGNYKLKGSKKVI